MSDHDHNPNPSPSTPPPSPFSPDGAQRFDCSTVTDALVHAMEHADEIGTVMVIGTLKHRPGVIILSNIPDPGGVIILLKKVESFVMSIVIQQEVQGFVSRGWDPSESQNDKNGENGEGDEGDNGHPR